MTKRIITFGELLMRLKTPNHQRFAQARSFEASFGGGEANVAVSLAQFGMDAAIVSALPGNPLGHLACGEFKRLGVDMGHVQFHSARMGLYFMETGTNQRSGNVVYDRAGSAFALLEKNAFDWAGIFKGADWFHISGISPAVSQAAADLSIMAVKAAKAAGVKVSVDINHRAKLWQYGVDPKQVMPEIINYCDVLIAGREDSQKSLGIYGKGDPDSPAYFESLSQTLMNTFKNLEAVAITIRDTQTADHHKWSACMRTDGKMLFSKSYEIMDIVDRVGSGDAFAAGLIYGLLQDMSRQDVLEFAAAANCLKHSIEGDFNLVSAEEVLRLRGGDSTGRVQR